MIHLRHPIHGVKIAYVEAEANLDKQNGWQVYADIPQAEAVLDEKTHQETSQALQSCPKCGKEMKRGLTMHIRHCKA